MESGFISLLVTTSTTPLHVRQFPIKTFDDQDLKIDQEWLKSPCPTINYESPCQCDKRQVLII